MIISTKNLFPIIKNRNNFIFEHPMLHPSTEEYKNYWREQLQRIVEGYWGIDSQNPRDFEWRYMSPALYYYTNIFKILLIDSKNKRSSLSRPWLLDIAWTYSYIWLICKGFSGFEYDEEYTCHWTVKLIEDRNANPSLPELDPSQYELLHVSCYKKDGTFKKYIDPLEYLNGTHKRNLGLPLYFNKALNAFILGSRGGSKSYFAAAIISQEFLTDGCKTMHEYFEKDENGKRIAKSIIFAGAPLADKTMDLLKKVEDGFNNMPGVYKVGSEYKASPLSKRHRGSFKIDGEYIAGYDKQTGDQWEAQGGNTFIKMKTFFTNKQAAAGLRYTTMIVDEVGLESDLLTVHGSNEFTMKVDSIKFGSAWYGGTGGDMLKVIESEIIFRDPVAYDMLAFEDVYENRGHIGFFIPAEYTNFSYKDENGNTILDQAIAYETYQRTLKKKAKNNAAYDEYIMGKPRVPSEMFLSKAGNKFPQALLRLQQADNDRKKVEKYIESIGVLESCDKSTYKVKFSPANLKPLRKYQLDSNPDLKGALVVYEHPPALIPNNLYKVVYDPVRDENGGTSLASIIVYKGRNTMDHTGNMIVAHWAGRYDSVDAIHEICCNIAKYFNAQVMFENNIPDFKNYCLRTNQFHLLAPTPYQAISKAIKEPSKKWDVGIPMSKPLGEYAEKLALQWLLTDRKTWEEDGEEHTLKNYQTIYDNALLDEFISYNSTGNFDRVSAFKLLMLWLIQDDEEVKSYNALQERIAINDFYTSIHTPKKVHKSLIY